MKDAKVPLFSMLKSARDLTVAAPFWLMAFVAFLLRIFVVQPLGAVLALVIGTVWCWGNLAGIHKFARKVVGR